MTWPFGPILASQAGGGSGRGFRLGPATNAFSGAGYAAAETARDAYAMANAAWLARYDADGSLAIVLTNTRRNPDQIKYQVRQSGAWVDLLNALRGPRGEAATGTPIAAHSTITPADVTITEAASFISTALFTVPKGIFLVQPTFSWSTAPYEVSAAHSGLYREADSVTLVQFNWYYNDGASSGTVTPSAQLLFVPQEYDDVEFYVSWPGDSTTGTLSGVTINFYKLAGLS